MNNPDPDLPTCRIASADIDAAETIASEQARKSAGPTWQDRSLPPEQRAALVLAAMTEDEKFNWLSGPMALPTAAAKIPDGALGSAAYYPGIPRLGIPAQQQSDASLGVSNTANVRPGDNATALPSSLLLGATFDPATARETGEMVGREAWAKGFNVQLAGGANIVREPRGGRNFEYVSEDPLLTGIIAGHSVAGIQSQGVVSTVKHFAVNPQETGRVLANSVLDLDALHESDLLAFRIAIEIGAPGAVMPGYNLVNGDWASESSYLITTVLKGEWRYPGWVMSDWGATHSTVKAALAGLDVQSGANLDPEPFFANPLRSAAAAGRIPKARIDDMVARQLRSLFAVGAIDTPAKPGGAIDYMAHRLIAQRAAERGIVLLKNENRILPAAKGLKHLLVIGRRADIGVLAGGGSAAVSPVGSLLVEGVEVMGVPMARVYHPSSPLHAIRAEAGAATVNFVDGTDIAATVTAAADADMVFLFVEEWRTEGEDRPGLNLPDDQNALIAAVAETNPRTVVIVQSGGAVAMPWLDDVPAVLAVFYPGSGGGEAIAGILFGRVNPSGHLPISFPRDIAQLPRPEQQDPETTTSNPGMPVKGAVFNVDYNVEGSDVGYRWYTREGLVPLFPFGHGMSYTSFEHAGLTVDHSDGEVVAEITVRNSGERAGATVAQLYVRQRGRGGFVPRLGGFARVDLDPGESRRVAIRVDPRVFARFDATTLRWVRAAGVYEVQVTEKAGENGQAISLELPFSSFTG